MKLNQIIGLLFLVLSSVWFSGCKKETTKPAPPDVSFLFTGDNNPAPCIVTFSNSSKNATSYSWNFGDGSPSVTEQNPQHLFTTAGVYNVVLKATGDGGSNTSNKLVTIKYPLPGANFTFSGDENPAPCIVSFTNNSTNATSHSWNFGDGYTSTEVNPQHTYLNGGEFQVVLISQGQGGSSSMTKNLVIHFPDPVANFSFSGDNGPAPCAVSFSNYSINATSYYWDFGDGETSSAINPQHIYTFAGVFNVQLTAMGNGSSGSITKLVSILSGSTGTDITFNNPLYTDIHITLNGMTQTIYPGGSVSFYSVPGNSVSYSAYTYGETTTGTQIGLELDWNYTINLSGGTQSYNLVSSSDYFYLFMRNGGTHYLTPLYVNYGLFDETVDYILVPNDNVKYNIGYYHANSNTEVRTYYQDQPSSYTWWSNLSFPWTNNQSIVLYNSFDSPTNIDQFHKSVSNAMLLKPQLTMAETEKFDKKGINVFCK